jgi:hypothetical protein
MQSKSLYETALIDVRWDSTKAEDHLDLDSETSKINK